MKWLLGCGPGSVAIGPLPDDTSEVPVDGCGLVAESQALYTVEDERVRVDAWCSSGAEVLLVGPGEIDDDEWSWRPELDEAGRHEVVVSWGLESAVFDVHVADAWDDSDNELVDPLVYREEFGLPVVHVFPEGSVGQEYVAARVVFEGREYEGARVKVRGAASSYYPKVGYTVDFDSEDQLELSDRGLGDKAHIVLISTFDDNSYVRQNLAYGLWEDIAEHFGEARLTPRTFHVVGDNKRKRDEVRILRMSEPDPSAGGGTITGIESVALSYPDDPQNAEALMVDPTDGEIYVLTKGATSTLFRADLERGEMVEVTTIDPRRWRLDERHDVTAADVTTDGKVLVRMYDHILAWNLADGGLSSTFEGTACRVPHTYEPQGEALGASPTGFHTASEGPGAAVYAYSRR